MGIRLGKRNRIALAATALTAAIVGLLAGQRWSSASSTGDPNAVAFSGFLEESGQPVSGKRDVSLRFFEDAAGGSAICPDSVASVDVTDGYFSVTASSACVDGLRRQRSAWYRLTVGATALPVTRVPTSIFALRTEDSQGGSRLRPRLLVGTDGSRSADPNAWFDSKLAKNCHISALFGLASPSFCVPEGVSGISVNGSGGWSQAQETTLDSTVSGSCAAGCTYHFSSDCSGANQLSGTLKAYWDLPFGLGIVLAPQYVADQSTQKLHAATKVFESPPFTNLSVAAGPSFCFTLVSGLTTPVKVTAYAKGAVVTPDWVTFQEQTL